MQEGSVAQKAKLIVDGEEIPGLVKLGEVALEKGTIEVPTPFKIVKIQNGVSTMPEVPATFETRRDTNTKKRLSDWYKNDEQHDVTVVYFDAGGAEYARYLWPKTECKKKTIPETDHASPTFAKLDVIFLPQDVFEVE